VDPITGETLLELPPPTAGRHFESIAVSDDGSLLATGTDGVGSVVMWDAVSGRQVRDLGYLGDTVISLEFNREGSLLAGVAPGVGQVRVWDIASGEVVAYYSDPLSWDVCCPPVRGVFSPDATRLAVTMEDEVRILDGATGDLVSTLNVHESVTSAAVFLPDGATIVTGGYDGTFRFWDVDTGVEIAAVDAGVGQLLSLAVSRDGRALLTGGDRGGVRLWEVEPGGARLVADLFGLRGFVIDVAFDHSGSIGSGTAGGLVATWDVTASGPGEVTARTGLGPVAFDATGERLAHAGPAGRDVVIVSTTDWESRLVIEEVAPYVGNASIGEWGTVAGLAFSPDGTTLAITTNGYEVVPGEVALYDTATGEVLHTLLDHLFLKGPVAFSGDGTLVAAATCALPGSTASVWDVAGGALVFAAPPDRCGQAVDLDSDGGLVAVQTITEVRPNVQVLDTHTGDLVVEMDHMPSWIGAVDFAPDGRRLLTAGESGTVRVWDAATGDRLVTLEGHTGPVESATWSSDGARIVSGSLDGTVRLWDAGTGENLLVLSGHDDIPYVALSPDGRYLASSAGGVVRVWALEIDDVVAVARNRVTRSLTSGECVTYHFDDCGPAG
jgi:WD40 repeat protein